MKQARAHGFTIVELLIVIVVIAILAAITLTAYNNVTMQARNSQTVTAVNAYLKALRLYAMDNGAYPVNQTSCLGDGYGDYNGDSSPGDCWHLNSPAKENTTFENGIKKYAPALPLPNMKIINAPSYNHIGAIYQYSTNTTVDGSTYTWFLAYSMEGGTTKCPVGPVLSYAAGGWPNFSSTPPASGYTGTYGSVATECWIALPDPSKL